MFNASNLLTGARQFVALHSDRLGLSLLQLREQLLEAIAQRVATAVADAVQAVTKGALGYGYAHCRSLNAMGPEGCERHWGNALDQLARPPLQRFSQQEDDEDEGWLDDDLGPALEPQATPKPQASRLRLQTLAIAALCTLLSWLGAGMLAKSIHELRGLDHVLGMGLTWLAA